MEKTLAMLYAKYVAVENRSLTKEMHDQLMAGNTSVAIGILEQRKTDLRAKNSSLLWEPTGGEIESMVDSLDQTIEILKQP